MATRDRQLGRPRIARHAARLGLARLSWLTWALALTQGTSAAAQSTGSRERLEWLELPTGLPPHDDISTVAFGDDPDTLFVGTVAGFVYRSRDGGYSFSTLFTPQAFEPVIDQELRDLRVSTVGDLGWSQGRGYDPRDRAGAARRQADLAGNVRGDLRDRGFPLLASVVRQECRDVPTVRRIGLCDGITYIATGVGLFRAATDGSPFVRLATGSGSGGNRGVSWVSCDGDRPGHLVAVSGELILESFDRGDTFALLGNPVGVVRPETVSFGSGGRLLVYGERRVLRERPDRRGWDIVCEFVGDSPDAETIDWAWWVPSGRTWALSADGLLECGGEQSRRRSFFVREPIRFFWVDEPREHHLFAATARHLLESDDGGENFRIVFTSPTQRSIQRVMTHDARPEAVLVVTGGQLFRRLPPRPRSADPSALVQRLLDEAPLDEVLRTALERLELTPGQTASTRANIWIQALLPRLVGRLRVEEAKAALAFTDRGVAVDRTGRDTPGSSAWQVLALWDLSDLVYDPIETDTTWVDLERLRSRITYAVQDHYIAWVNAVVQLAEPALPPTRRAAFEIRKRQAQAYLDHLTGGAFAAFHSPENNAL